MISGGDVGQLKAFHKMQKRDGGSAQVGESKQ